MRPAVFLDRDGTLVEEVGYLSRLADLRVLPGVPGALVRFARAGFARIVVTNQSGVARGRFPPAFVERAHAELRRRLRRRGADVEGFYVCPHHPEHGGPCPCRKPAPGLLLRAAADWDVDLAASWVVGDKAADLELARNAGCRAALVRTGYGRETEARVREGEAPRPDLVADDLAAATEAILGRRPPAGASG
ncbi:MAG: D-glycero-beta-D-manno-heptose 1,7-bisphosphate 7-phosphatase [Deferrisomatales bacterium]